MGFVGQIVGLLVGAAVGCRDGTVTEGCLLSILFGGFAGNIAMTPLGTIIAGDLLSGTGDYLGALGGTALGTLVQMAIAVPLALTDMDQGTFTAASIALSVLPAIGAMVGYELQSGSNNAEMRRTGIALSPTAAPLFTADGRLDGAMVGVQLTEL